jgi:hypothetical protein
VPASWTRNAPSGAGIPDGTSLITARKQFWQAIHSLVSDESIQDRLADAAMVLTRISRQEDLPENIREEFNAVMQKLINERARVAQAAVELVR